jgi:4-diphosphocytidyl-2-C-methyl-D-erythritol kinase
LEIKAPAKINIGLNIVRKREDGYHDLETLFYPLNNLCDAILIEESNSLEILTDSPALKKQEDNLIYKAVKLLSKEIGNEIKVKITLEKNIPIGAGLGGGSSDAAATLKALNELFELKIPKERLLKLALRLGSDVPFFIDAKPAFGFSRGEVLIPFKLKIPYPILIVYPNIHVSTKEAFGNIKPQVPKTTIKEIIETYKFSPDVWREKIRNDFEKTVFKVHPLIKGIKELMLSAGALFAQMTGSGSTVYGIFDKAEKALEVKEKLGKEYFTFVEY